MAGKSRKADRNPEQEPEIRLKDLASYILHRWKIILLVMIVLAAALGGWQYLRVKKAHDAGELTKDEMRYEQDVKSYEEKLESAQKNVDELRNSLNWKREYHDTSLLIQLDLENVWTAEKVYLISGTQSGPEGTAPTEGTATSMEDLLAVYTNAMGTDHDEAALEAAFGTGSAGFVKEVVEITANPEEKTFRAAVHASSKEAAEKGLAYVEKTIEAAEERAQGIRPHTLQTVSEGTAKDVLPGLAEMQIDLTEETMKAESKLEKAESLLVDARVSVPYNPGNPVVRWAVTGAALGLIIMVFIYLTLYVCSQKRVTGDRHH